MPKDWHERDAYVYACAKPDPRYGHIEDRIIDVEKEHSEAREKEKQREVQQRGQCFNCPREMKLVDALSKERTNSRSLVWTVSCLGEFHVPTRPSLQQSRQECACETDDQAQEPQ